MSRSGATSGTGPKDTKDKGPEPLNDILTGESLDELKTNLPDQIYTEFSQGEFYGHSVAYKQAKETDTSEVKIVPPIQSFLPAGLVPCLEWIKNTNKLRIMFKGTSDIYSARRDLETGGAGHQTFWQEQTTDYLRDTINQVLKEIHQVYPKEIVVDIDGHSLGAADAQNCLALLLKCMDACTTPDKEVTDSYFCKIKTINLHCFNATGICKETNELAKSLLNQIQINLAQKKEAPVKIRCFWLHATQDAIQQTGETSIFAGIDSLAVEHHMLYVSHKKGERSWLPPRNWQNDTHQAHTRKIFSLTADFSWCYATNLTSAGNVFIQRRLQNKSQVLQSLVAIIPQYFINLIINTLYPSTPSQTYVPSSSDLNRLPLEPAILVNVEEASIPSMVEVAVETPATVIAATSTPQVVEVKVTLPPVISASSTPHLVEVKMTPPPVAASPTPHTVEVPVVTPATVIATISNSGPKILGQNENSAAQTPAPIVTVTPATDSVPIPSSTLLNTANSDTQSSASGENTDSNELINLNVSPLSSREQSSIGSLSDSLSDRKDNSTSNDHASFSQNSSEKKTEDEDQELTARENLRKSHFLSWLLITVFEKTYGRNKPSEIKIQEVNVQNISAFLKSILFILWGTRKKGDNRPYSRLELIASVLMLNFIKNILKLVTEFLPASLVALSTVYLCMYNKNVFFEALKFLSRCLFYLGQSLTSPIRSYDSFRDYLLKRKWSMFSSQLIASLSFIFSIAAISTIAIFTAPMIASIGFLTALGPMVHAIGTAPLIASIGSNLAFAITQAVSFVGITVTAATQAYSALAAATTFLLFSMGLTTKLFIKPVINKMSCLGGTPREGEKQSSAKIMEKIRSNDSSGSAQLVQEEASESDEESRVSIYTSRNEPPILDESRVASALGSMLGQSEVESDNEAALLPNSPRR